MRWFSESEGKLYLLNIDIYKIFYKSTYHSEFSQEQGICQGMGAMSVEIK